ncbi:MAG: phosphoribosylformylglycinamidine cyclo-ligase [Candidatus Altiarchaeales archaeon]|nr:MAG: phosphoribosylformylglycinamidine cyclo-ligase [Candidatus Altiarchaeales archaeon]RLI94345.1 MAG: phosphoribosylformylglycinamidine cyclo-ligase [Candidatus Altiarchaeales archaeon]RLI95363.1 MAG: phosphoribosylformylglycinamidine cyclo-ligase [Candidatus Altiarchaeales archaeon]HDO82718.1 phosphoribosylformylglycinamidine cyclo-ligase [Candidatus Altiarchaeales archaeon]HEX55367.1 phosphoribosylformylglycinamidine cyclo-ligase [Candidatus Altiarchaeales archaeon]
MTYTKSGVSIEREELAIKKIKSIVERTFKFRRKRIGNVIEDIGKFANLIDIGNGNALAISMDGVGSKVLVARELNRYDTVGIDLVAMNVNDLICVGAEPIAMVDYIGATYIDPKIMREISIGMYEGAKRAGIAIVGGEIATLPEIIKGIDKFGFDLVGTAIGILSINKIITGDRISPGDAVLGFRSSGIHSNGLTLARRVLPKNAWVDLLVPTRIYVPEFLELSKGFDILGIAHITGGGLRNLLRITKFGFYLDNLPPPQPIFRRIQEEGKISDKEMYRTFNMGIGLCMVVKENDAEEILKRYARRFEIMKIGHIVEEHSIRIVRNGSEITL